MTWRPTRALKMRDKNKNVYLIKGPDKPTSQLLPIITSKQGLSTEKGGKTKEVVEDRSFQTVVCERVVYECERVVCERVVCEKVVKELCACVGGLRVRV